MIQRTGFRLYVVQLLATVSAILSGAAVWATLSPSAPAERRLVPVPTGRAVPPGPAGEPSNVIDLTASETVLAPVGVVRKIKSFEDARQSRRSVGASAPLTAVPGPDAGTDYRPPRFGRGSKAQRREWVLPRRVVPAGVAGDAAHLGGLTVRAASVVGPGHRCEEPAGPRQDAYTVTVDPGGGHVVAAVADGVSSSRYAEVGAQIAADTAARELAAARPGADDHQAYHQVYREAARQMSAHAAACRWPDEDLCAALVTAVVPAVVDERGHRRARLAWVGDVSAWLLREGRWSCVAGDRKHDDGLASNAVSNPLPFGATAVETTEVTLTGGDVLVLVTDGVGDGLATLPPLREYLASRWRQPVPVSAFIDDVGYDAERFLDDRTAVCVWAGDPAPGGPVGVR